MLILAGEVGSWEGTCGRGRDPRLAEDSEAGDLRFSRPRSSWVLRARRPLWWLMRLWTFSTEGSRRGERRWSRTSWCLAMLTLRSSMGPRVVARAPVRKGVGR